jgi:hypothetical protein
MSDSPAVILYKSGSPPTEIGTAANPLRVDPTGDHSQPVTFSATTTTSTINSSTSNLSAGSTFGGSSESVSGVTGIQVSCVSDQPILMNVYQSSDGTNWDIYNEWLVLPSDNINTRTIQAIGKYVKVTANNRGGATTSYLRLQTNLHSDAQAIPRAVTDRGCLRVSKQTDSFNPAPQNFVNRDSAPDLSIDVGGALYTRGAIYTDELSYRDDFTVGAIYTDISGTVYFNNGADHVTGNGTAFTTALRVGDYIKISSHADSAYAQISSIESDTYLTLSYAYAGVTASGTGRTSRWAYASASSGSFSQGSSLANMASGTTSGAYAAMSREGDYLPFSIIVRAALSQRIANQEASFGFIDNTSTPNSQALVVFTGTDNTQVTLRTATSSGDSESTTATLPGGANTASQNTYQLEVLSQSVSLWVNDVKLITHRVHIPDPYIEMMLRAVVSNTGTAASSTTLALDAIFFSNFDRVEVQSSAKGDPLPTKEMRANTSTLANVAASASSVTLLASNANRLGAMIYNDSTAVLYVKFGTTASATSHTMQLQRYDYYEVPAGYTGRIDGIWTAATGNARVTEVS